MTEVEYGGVKLTGSKLFMIIPLVSMLGGGLWAGFEFYKDYMDMKEQIQEYVAPDLSEFDKKIAIIEEHQKTVEAHMDFVEEELALFKDTFKDVRNSLSDTTDYLRDTKHDLKNEMVRIEKHLDRVEDEVTSVETEARTLADSLKVDVRALLDEGETEQDRLKRDVRAMIDDANNRFNDKISGLEGYVKRELDTLEDRLNEKLTKALENPLAN
tara:strand:+ start:192 stop:830 length:639 start_codon:yes stop_codon:yes gene_type:complete